ncbi:MAG: SDR family NAD(P)-dependent oxidoreductase [Flavobacteriales bacterium]|nr:MAG: SDR family NAD(P)-dependent oxidoreductase [Flavobacteriales bacterium]
MIIVTGASKGIGKYLSTRYVEIGEDVYGSCNSTIIEPKEKNIKLFQLDISDYNQVKSWVQSVEGDLKNITLINCAGINYNCFAHKADISKWREVIEVNLLGTFNLINCLLPLMREENFGRIINFGSVVAEIPSPGVSAYAASKSALYGMSKSIASENATKGITINNVNLGYSELGMISQVPEKFLDEIKRRIPSNQLCKPEDIFNTVEFLRQTVYINGSTINISGGLI